jgi:hypothetical protein
MVEITYQMVLSPLQTVSLMVGVIYYIFIMRNSQKNQQMQLETRQTQLFMQFNDRREPLRDVWNEILVNGLGRITMTLCGNMVQNRILKNG